MEKKEFEKKVRRLTNAANDFGKEDAFFGIVVTENFDIAVIAPKGGEQEALIGSVLSKSIAEVLEEGGTDAEQFVGNLILKSIGTVMCTRYSGLLHKTLNNMFKENAPKAIADAVDNIREMLFHGSDNPHNCADCDLLDVCNAEKAVEYKKEHNGKK